MLLREWLKQTIAVYHTKDWSDDEREDSIPRKKNPRYWFTCKSELWERQSDIVRSMSKPMFLSWRDSRQEQSRPYPSGSRAAPDSGPCALMPVCFRSSSSGSCRSAPAWFQRPILNMCNT